MTAPVQSLGRRLLTRPLASGGGSAISPLNDTVTWVAWRLLGARTVSRDDGTLQAASSVFGRVAEALWLPGRVVAFTELAWDPAQRTLEVCLAVGVMGQRGTTVPEAEHVASFLDVRLTAAELPFSVAAVDPALVLDVEPQVLRHTALVRQRLLGIDLPSEDGEPSSVDVLTRFNPLMNSAEQVARCLSTRTAATRFRATILPTELGPDDCGTLDEQIRRVTRARRRLDGQPEHALTVDRVAATLHDLKASFASPLLVGEVSVASADPLPDTFLRTVGACHTSESDVLRRSGFTTVAGQALLLGGFEVQLDPPGHVQALRAGLPLYGGMRTRGLRDVVTLTECPLGWPVPVNAPVPGLPSISVKQRPRPDLLAPAEGWRSEAVLGHDATGQPVVLPWEHRTTHTLITGTTGSGKTTLLDALVRADIAAGRPFFLVDSHGPWYERARSQAEAAGLSPVCFDVRDPDTARIAPTPALQNDEGSRERVLRAARAFCDAFSSHLPSAEWAGPMFNQRGTAALELAAAYQVELVVVLGWLGDPQRLAEALDTDLLSPVSRSSLRSMSKQTSGDGLAGLEWVQSKWTALANGPARRLLTRPGLGTDPARELLTGRPVLVNLAGLTPADSSVMGHVLLQLILDGVLDSTPDATRQLAGYVDEAHRIAPHNLERAWTEARKFGLALTAATQTHQQFPSTLRDLALSAGTVVAFRQAPSAARELHALTGVSADELVGQPDLHAVVHTTKATACTVTVEPYPPTPDLAPFGPLPALASGDLSPEAARAALEPASTWARGPGHHDGSRATATQRPPSDSHYGPLSMSTAPNILTWLERRRLQSSP